MRLSLSLFVCVCEIQKRGGDPQSARLEGRAYKIITQLQFDVRSREKQGREKKSTDC